MYKRIHPSNGKYKRYIFLKHTWIYHQFICKWINVYVFVHLVESLDCTIVITRRLSSVHPSVVNYSIFDFSSVTTEHNFPTLDRKQELNVLYQVCVWGRSEKGWLPNPLSCLDIDDFFATAEQNLPTLDRRQDFNMHFQIFVIRLIEKKPIWPPRPLISWCMFDSLKALNEIGRNLTGSKNLMA